MDGGNGEGDGGEKSGREGEGVSEEGRKVYCTREGERERVFVIFSGTCISENLPAVKGCTKPSRMCTCVLYKVPDSCCPILLKVPTLWGSFEIKNVRLAKIMLRQLSA